MPVQVSPNFLDKIFEIVFKNPQTNLVIDLKKQTVEIEGTSQIESFDINGYKKNNLLNGYDDIDYLLNIKIQSRHFQLKLHYKVNKKKIEIMDTTLRDGEQTSGMSFSEYEKLTISKLLLKDLMVDRIEVASARVSSGEFNAVKKILDWAKTENLENKVEILTFIDDGISLDWMNKSGAKIQNLLSKGSLNHLKYQLKKTPQQHFNDVEKIIEIANKSKIETNIYLEDWSNGMKNSKDYVFSFLNFLEKMPIKRVLLPDTLGVLNRKMLIII